MEIDSQLVVGASLTFKGLNQAGPDDLGVHLLPA